MKKPSKLRCAFTLYARQSKDLEMFDMARRIQARAIDKCGELLRQIPKKEAALGAEKQMPPRVFL